MSNNDANFKKIITTVMLCFVISILSIVAITISFFIKPQSAYDIAVKNGFVGTEQQWLASLKGDTGNQGNKGDQGSTGKSAYELAVENGFVGTEQQWLESLEGEDGDDAYELAVENGFNGTKTEWIASLKGEKGNKGDKGDAGDDGDDAIAIEQLTINRLNAKLETVDLVENKTLFERFNSADISNNQLKRLTATYLYSYNDNEFIAVDGAGSIAYTTSDLSNYEIGKDVTEDINLFTFVLSNNLSSDYSNYLVGGTQTVLNISTGIDVGEVENIITINYTNETSVAKNVVIRTNSLITNLSIDDESTGKIYHYGSTGTLNIIQCHTGSYYEHGSVAFVEIAKGRIVLTEDSNIEVININKKDENTYNNPIIADAGVKAENMPEIISRDQVTVTDERGKTELVQIQTLDANGNIVVANSEQVYVYSNGAVGTTEKVTTGVNTQNEDIDTPLGIIVLDSGSHAGEKAYGIVDEQGNHKNVLKEEHASEACSAEFTSGTNNNDYVARIYQTGYMSLESAIEAAQKNEVVVLLKDVEIGVIGINKVISLDGGNHTISGKAGAGYTDGETYSVSDKSGIRIENISDTTGTINIKNFRLTNIGNTNAIYVGDGSTEGVAEDLQLNFFNISIDHIKRNGIGIYGGTFAIDNCKIDGAYVTSDTDNQIQLDGTYSAYILRGTISNCTFTDSKDESDEWTSAGITMFDGIDLIVNNCSFKNNSVAIATATYDKASIDAVIRNCTIENCERGIFMNDYFKSCSANNRVCITLESGNYFIGDEPVQIYKECSGSKFILNITGGTYICKEHYYSYGDGIKPFAVYDCTMDEKTSDYIDILITSGKFVYNDTDVSSQYVGNDFLNNIIAIACWYSNGAWNNGNGSTSGQYLAGNCSIFDIFNEGWLGDGEGIKLIQNIDLNSGVTCQMPSGSFYLYFQDFDFSSGTIELNKNVSVISDTSGKASCFSGGTITEIDNGDGTYTYTCN